MARPDYRNDFDAFKSNCKIIVAAINDGEWLDPDQMLGLQAFRGTARMRVQSSS
jgi:hypothetical protein